MVLCPALEKNHIKYEHMFDELEKNHKQDENMQIK